MTQSASRSEIGEQLAYLRADAFREILVLLALVSYAWLVKTVWPPYGETTPVAAWLGSTVLSAAVILAVLFRRHQRFAFLLVLSAMTIAIPCAAVAFRSAELVYLLILVIIFASVLLGQRAVMTFGAAGILLSYWAVATFADAPDSSYNWYLPLIVIALAALAAIVSVRTLYTALFWAMEHYERSQESQRQAQEQQAELKQALRSLDTATYNLERANAMLGFARARAEESHRLKQQFAQNISHELRTPLNLIVGFAETMIQSPGYYGESLPAPYLRDLNIIYRNAQHLQTLVNDVLDLARIEAAQMALTVEETDPAQLVSEALTTIRTLVESRGLTLDADVAPGLPRLWIDPTRIRQVIFNLVSNAARFTEQGGITVRAFRDEGQVVFAVIDTGIGIAASDLERIFEAFHQVEGGLHRRRGGIGLGLAISKQFVELHGGRIWVESEVERGSTFFFALPVVKTLSPEQERMPALSAVASPPPPRGRERILLTVTRSPSAAAMLSRYIRDCRTVFVDSIEQAEQFARTGAPQAVIIDTACVELEPTSLQALACDWGLAHVPMVMCPLPGEEQLRVKLATSGYLIKPVSRQGLWDAILQVGDDIDRVLIIDDDHDFVRLLARMLSHPVRHYQVLSAYSGQEGLAMMEHYRPDLILMDLGLPDISGLRMLDIIRSTPALEHTPVIIVSGHDEVDIMETLQGSMTVTRAAGLVRGDVIQWIQKVLDTAARTVTLVPR